MALPKVTYINFDKGCTWSVGRDEWLFFLVPAFLLYYVAPLLCIAINCGLIIGQLRGCRGTLAADRRNKKATALLIGSTVVFAVSWLPYYALEFVNVMSPHVSSVAFPHGYFEQRTGSTSSPAPPGSEGRVSLLWEVASLTAILLVCLAPCWNPPLYFLLSRPAVRQLRALLPHFLRSTLAKASVQRWQIAPAPPSPVRPHPQCPVHSEAQQTVTHSAAS